MKAALAAAAAIAVVGVVTVTGALAGAAGPTLSQASTGDPRIVSELREALEDADGARHAAVACVVTSEQIRYGGLGADAGTEFEVGSLTKTFTGELLAEAIERGEVRADTRVGELLDLEGSAIADVTLEELATHRSGLGEWGDDARDNTLATWWVQDVLGGTVHDISEDDLLARVRSDPLTSRGEYSYSNAGVALLGMALAEAADAPYDFLLRTRILVPAGMSQTRLGTDQQLDRGRGFTMQGRRAPAWNLGAYTPAGGALSTASDMCRYAQALLIQDRQAQEGEDTSSARDAAPSVADGSIGFTWNLRRSPDGTVAWKTGETGGYASFIALSPGSDRAVVVLSDTATSVEGAGWDLLE